VENSAVSNQTIFEADVEVDDVRTSRARCAQIKTFTVFSEKSVFYELKNDVFNKRTNDVQQIARFRGATHPRKLSKPTAPHKSYRERGHRIFHGLYERNSNELGG
jgi:hypothetical protein